MLCVNNYTQKYIDECRSRVAAQVSAYQALVATARNQTATDEPLVGAAIEAFEPHFFNNMVLALDSYFVHRTRAIEKKDGNPLNEVRMLCNSILIHIIWTTMVISLILMPILQKLSIDPGTPEISEMHNIIPG